MVAVDGPDVDRPDSQLDKGASAVSEIVLAAVTIGGLAIFSSLLAAEARREWREWLNWQRHRRGRR